MMLLFVASCSDKTHSASSDKFYQGSLTRKDVIGTWVMTPSSVAELSDYCGYQRYTNPTDQTITLRADGTCTFRGFDKFGTTLVWLTSEEEQFSHSWQDQWAGSTNGFSLGKGKDIPNWARGDRWTEWEFIDNGAAGPLNVFWNGLRPRYVIKFSHTNVIGSIIRRIGKWDGDVMLWLEIDDSLKSKSLSDYRIVRYRREARVDITSQNKEAVETEQ